MGVWWSRGGGGEGKLGSVRRVVGGERWRTKNIDGC